MNVDSKSAENVTQVVPFLGTGLSDPDGYRSFFGSPTDTPEETKLSELKAA